MAKRRNRPPAERLRLFQLHSGICHICGQKITQGERWEIEHVVPFELTKDDSDENVRPAHASCHSAKTAADKGAIAKAKRLEQKHRGAHRPKTPFPGSRNSKWKRKMDGSVVLR